WFFHVADESLSSRRAQDVDVVLGRSKSGNCFESEIERQERTNTSAIGFSRPTQGRPRGFHRRRCAKGRNDGNPRFLGATPADCSASRSSAAFFRQGRTFLFEPNWPLRTGLSDFTRQLRSRLALARRGRSHRRLSLLPLRAGAYCSLQPKDEVNHFAAESDRAGVF